ncbi:hypothetical protein Pfo_019785 [Paulownia fortunei]|nr:hypothetical protein Pfo_019785 [Paulownia fortunei]
MESNRSKRRGFSKSKLVMSFYRATKPSSAFSGKPKSSPTNSSLTSLEFVANQPIKPKAPPSSTTAASPAVGLIIVNQDQVFPPQKPNVAFVVPDRNGDSYGKLENFYGAAAEDEAVDVKAARYISSVQERFQLERVNSDRKNIEDMQL